MFEKVNPSHPDKIADRIAGALVDIAYKKTESPKIAVEVLIGHGVCHIIAESSVNISAEEASSVVWRIAGPYISIDYTIVPQDEMLAKNQSQEIRCGDNGIFKGCPNTKEQQELSKIAHSIYNKYPSDGKYIIDELELTICQSDAYSYTLQILYPTAYINPLGDWIGGLGVDTGATNRKLGSDMGDAVTGGGLHGKDLSKSDVSVNIYLHMLAEKEQKTITASCAIGDDRLVIDNKTIMYKDIVEFAKTYIDKIGGFEKLAEWGLI